MPVGITNSVTLSEDTQGMLRADLKLSPSSRNLLAMAPGAPVSPSLTSLPPTAPVAPAPGVYGFQAEPACAMAYSIPFGSSLPNAPSGLFVITSTGAGAAFQTIPFQTEAFDQDGLGDVTSEIVDATNGLFTVPVPGYWRAGCHVHIGDPTGLQASTGGQPSQVVVRAISSFTGGGSPTGPGTVVSIGSQNRYGGGAPAAIYGKWPWFFGPSLNCSSLWPMDAGAQFIFGVRMFSGGGVMSAPNSTPEHPYTFDAWAYLARPF